ncbi:MAG: hypothetical protein KH283_06645 [Collinsella sp.]|nr:hypothetical protein [Collinsella sp.]
MSNVRVCVDVVGGDEKPQVVLDGIEAALAADPDIEVLAAGPAEIVNPFAASHARVEALEAPDVIAMDDDPIRAVMTKRKSSIVLSCRAIKKGNADAFFSAGSTGAMTADTILDEQKLQLALAKLEGRENADVLRAELTIRAAALREKLTAAEHDHLGTRRLLRAFPDMKSLNYADTLAATRAAMLRLRELAAAAKEKIKKA